MKITARLFLFTACTVCSWGQASLKGLTGVAVIVVFDEGKGTGAAAEKVITKYLQLDKDSIQTEVELRLREAGMTIRSPESDSTPLLIIQVSMAGQEAALVNVKLAEWATLDRRSIRAMIISWEKPGVFQAYQGRQIRDEIRDRVSAFLNTWLANQGR
jgi:hypothetical protein